MRHWITSFRLLTTPLFKEETIAGQGTFPGHGAMVWPISLAFSPAAATSHSCAVVAAFPRGFRRIACGTRPQSHMGEAPAHRNRGHAAAALALLQRLSHLGESRVAQVADRRHALGVLEVLQQGAPEAATRSASITGASRWASR